MDKPKTRWRMGGEIDGKRIIWQAESKTVVKVDTDRNNIFWLDNGCGATQNSLGRSYFRTREEAEKDFTEGEQGVIPLGDGKFETWEPDYKKPTHISCGRDGCKVG